MSTTDPASDPARTQRPSIIGADNGPSAPYPLKLEGEIVKGFGRGSKELGIPTANIPVDGLTVAGRSDITSGIYFGYAGLHAPADVHQGHESNGSADAKDHAVVYPMVMSVGWNPFYANSKRSVEIHLLHAFPRDFYGAHIRLLMLGFVREELDYVSKEALIDDIHTDIRVTRASLDRPAWKAFASDEWLCQGPS